jgi:L-fuconolactonase
MPVIDAHQHFWQLGRKPFDYSWLDAPQLAKIRRTFLPSDLKPHLDRAGVDRTIFVQTQHNVEENRWALQLADENPWIAGVVGWIDLASPACEAQLVEFKQHPKFVGVRHVTQDEPDDDFIVRPAVINGLRMLEKHSVPFDLLFYVKHLRHAATLAHALPNLPMVIDHLSKPAIKTGQRDDWLPYLKGASKFPNVFCKLSGMVTEADWHRWKPDDLRPYVEPALELFGHERCMYGSDWPVCEVAATYEQVIDALNEVLGPISTDERDAIFGGTAAGFYDLAIDDDN